MKKLTILVDMDGIVVDLLQAWLDAIDKRYGIEVNALEIDGWDMHKHPRLAPLGLDGVLAFLQEPGLFLNAKAIPGAVGVLKLLHNEGHDIVILSSPSGPVSAKEKLEWLQKHMPWLPLKNVMLANRKTLVRGDVLIDDHPQTVVDYARAWPEAQVLGIEYNYNKNVKEPHVHLYPAYPDTVPAWAKIGAHIHALSCVPEVE